MVNEHRIDHVLTERLPNGRYKVTFYDKETEQKTSIIATKQFLLSAIKSIKDKIQEIETLRLIRVQEDQA